MIFLKILKVKIVKAKEKEPVEKMRQRTKGSTRREGGSHRRWERRELGRGSAR